MILRFSQKLGSRLKAGTLKPLPMNELIAFAQVLLADEETSPFELGFRLNDMLLSASSTDESRDYGKPRDAFRALIVESKAP